MGLGPPTSESSEVLVDRLTPDCLYICQVSLYWSFHMSLFWSITSCSLFLHPKLLFQAHNFLPRILDLSWQFSAFSSPFPKPSYTVPIPNSLVLCSRSLVAGSKLCLIFIWQTRAERLCRASQCAWGWGSNMSKIRPNLNLDRPSNRKTQHNAIPINCGTEKGAYTSLVGRGNLRRLLEKGPSEQGGEGAPGSTRKGGGW